MRRHETSVTPLLGQLLFADVEAGTLTLDCILAKSGGTGSPMTFSAELPRRGHVPHLAIELLSQWAAEAAPIAVTITDGKAGPHVEIACSSHRVVLQSAGTEDA